MAITVGSVEVDVIPNTRGIYERLRTGLVPAATRAGEEAGGAAGRSFGPAMQREVGTAGLSIGQQIGQQIAARITAEIRGALRDGVNEGGRSARAAATRQGDETGGAFSRSLKDRLEVAFRTLPKVRVDADTSEADSDLQALRVRMETLSNQRIGIDVDAAAARTEVADIEEQLRRLGASHPNVAVRADTARARAELSAVREEIDRVSATPGHIRLETDGTLGQRLRSQIQAAEASLPNINISADTSPAQAEIAALRAQLTAMRDQRIGIDVDAATALARITEIQARLQRLSASDADVAVRVDAAAAVARLATIQALVSALDGQTARIDVDTSGALSAVLHLAVAIGGLAILPAVPVLAAGIGAIGSAAVASAAGVGALAAVAAPAFIGIASALQAQKAAQDAATSATDKGAQAGAQAASRALQMAGAQQALAAAERNGARQIAQAQQQVRQAKTAAADAIVQAAQRNAQAARQVQDAEKALAQSQKDARQAQIALTDARKQAGRELEDLANAYIDAQLSQRDAALGVEEAQQRLNAATANGSKASALERQQAQLAYDQAVQRLREQTTDTQRLKEKQEEASKTGVEGTDTYKQAQERLAQAQQGVADKVQAVQDAQRSATQAQLEAARQIAQAQERVGEATANVAVAQQSAADAVASAQRQIASAAASAAGGVDQAAIAQAKYQAALDKLTPSARGTFDAFQSLRTAFKAWSESLQPAVMPLFTRALEGVKNSLPGLTPFVLGAAKAIGILQDKISAGFKSPWWKSFRDDLAKSVVPATVGLGVAVGNVFKTLGGIVDAFLPHMDEVSDRMRTITGRWATWATGLKGSDKFTKFLAYASEQGPILAKLVGDIAAAFFQISRAVSPLAGPVLGTLGAVLTAVASIAETLPWLIQLMYAVWVATKLWTLAMIAFNLVMNANPIVLIITGIVALVAAVIYAYQHWGWFREAVDAAWRGIQAGAKVAWSILQPIFAAIWAALQFLGSVAVWLWENAIRPAFEGIWLAARVLFAILAVAVIVPLILAFKALAAVAMWLWEAIFAPVFHGIADAAIWLWQTVLRPVFTSVGDKAVSMWRDYISPAWEAIRLGTRLLGDKVREFWDSYVRPAFTLIGEKAAWLYENALKPAFDRIRTAVGYVKDAFVVAKDGIRAAWDQLVDITRKPVQFVVDHVYNKGIRPVWNAVAKIVDLDQLSEYKFATGGILPGYTPGRDVHLAALSGGEAIMRPEWTRAVGAGYVNTMNSAARTGGIGGVQQALGLPAFKDGGIFDSLVDAAGWVGSTFSKGVDLAKAGADLFLNPSKAWNSLAAPILSSIAGGVGATRFGQAVGGIPKEMLSGLGDLVGKTVRSIGSLFGGGGGGGVSRWTAVVQQALQMVGQPLDYTGITLRRMEQESGGDPTIVNRWDSNWIAGTPSVGLMQVIGPTFRAYAGAMRDVGPFLYGTSVNPLANVYASMRYALGQYGSLPRAYNQPGGYDSGGFLQPGMNLAYNGTGRPEPVLTTAQWNALTSSGKGGQPSTDQRSYQITLQGSQMTAAEQAADLMRHIAFST